MQLIKPFTFKVLLLIIFVLLILEATGCSKGAKEDDFSVGFTVNSLSLKTNEELIMEAMLSNRSNRTFDIDHGSAIFSFHVADESGNEINTFEMLMIGKVTKLKGKMTIPEQYKFTFEQSGKYSVWAVSEFFVGNKDEPFNMKSEVMHIEVQE